MTDGASADGRLLDPRVRLFARRPVPVPPPPTPGGPLPGLVLGVLAFFVLRWLCGR